jgi:hypothetical protein
MNLLEEENEGLILHALNERINQDDQNVLNSEDSNNGSFEQLFCPVEGCGKSFRNVSFSIV